MRQEFKELEELTRELCQGKLERQQMSVIKGFIILCSQMSKITTEEEIVLKLANRFWTIKDRELSISASKYSREFEALLQVGNEMKTQKTILLERLMEIKGIIDTCDHLKETEIQKGLVNAAKNLWKDKIGRLERESIKEIKRLPEPVKKPKKQWCLNSYDKRFLKGLRIAENDTREFTKDDINFLTRVARNEADGWGEDQFD